MVSALATELNSAHHVEEEMFSMLNFQKLANALRAMDTCPEQYKPYICMKHTGKDFLKASFKLAQKDFRESQFIIAALSPSSPMWSCIPSNIQAAPLVIS